MSLLGVFVAAAEGRYPPPDGTVQVHPGPPGKACGVVGFPARFYVLAPVDPGWVRAQLPPGDYSAPLGARFLVALADQIGAHIGTVDACWRLALTAAAVPWNCASWPTTATPGFAGHTATGTRSAPGRPPTGRAA